MKFRLAESKDVDHIQGILSQFYEGHEAMYGIPWCEESAKETIQETIDHGVVLVGKASCIGGIIKPWQWNKLQNIAFVTFWATSNHGGLRIFDAFRTIVERQFKARVIAASQFPDNRILRFYLKRGLKPMEVHAITPPWVAQ